MKQVLLILIFACSSLSAMAVDGYKNLMFGMSTNQLNYVDICTFSEDNPKDWYSWFRDFSRLRVFTCPDYKFGDRDIKISLTFIDQRLHKITLVHASSVKFNQMLLELLKNKYGFRPGKESVNLATTLYKFEDQTVEAEVFHPPGKTLLVHYFSNQFGWFMSKDPRDRKLIDEL